VTYRTKDQGGRRDHSGGEVPEGPPPALSVVRRMPAIDQSGDVADAPELAWPLHACGPGGPAEDGAGGAARRPAVGALDPFTRSRAAFGNAPANHGSEPLGGASVDDLDDGNRNP
jgi:hypothetical protein